MKNDSKKLKNALSIIGDTRVFPCKDTGVWLNVGLKIIEQTTNTMSNNDLSLFRHYRFLTHSYKYYIN